MTKATSSKKATTTKSTVKKTTPKSSSSKTSASTRSTTKARAATKKTTATRTASKKATTTKTATKAKPTPKKAAKSDTQPKAETAKAKTTSKTKPKPKKQSEKKTLNTATQSAAKAQLPAKPSKKAVDVPEDDDKPKIAPAPLRPALRVARRAEARRDKNQTFKVDTQIIYPAHGVGYIMDVEKQSIADIEVELFVINFEHEKMKLRVPTVKAATAGMRNLSSDEQIASALKLIEGKARIKRTMWSRRAQEYEAKINSGDLISVSEVVRDLFRADDQPEQSYSERQLFEQARERLGRELAAVRKGTLEEAIAEIHTHLDKKEKV